MNTKYKLCILAAGRGTRNQSIFGLHKALLPLENQSIISRIIKGVPKDVEIVIPVGYESEQVKTFLNIVFSDRKITFVDVENFDGPNSGPGLSLLMCESHLQCPFIFTSVDTIVENIDPDDGVNYNWIGVSDIVYEESEKYNYCLVKGDTKLEKLYYGKGSKVYNGRAGIYNYLAFWKSLRDNTLINGEHQVLNGFDGLNDIHLKPFIWHDTGNDEEYNKTRKKFNEVVAQKNDEVLYIENNKVIKYFSHSNRVNDRVNRTKSLNDTTPIITKINDNMYYYDLVPGKMLSDINNEEVLRDVIYFWYDKLGKKHFKKTDEFLNNCTYMYHDKTFERCNHFAETHLDEIEYINGVKVDKINNLLNRIDWESVYKNAIPTRFHGDFQPENIIHNGGYTLIDWRDKFGDSLEIGDFYYDLGKLYHSIFINGTDMSNELYKVKLSGKSTEISYHTRSNLLFLLDELKTFCIKNNYSWENVELLGILQYLGISSLYNDFHNGRYGEFLFLFGKYLLTKYLER